MVKRFLSAALCLLTASAFAQNGQPGLQPPVDTPASIGAVPAVKNCNIAFAGDSLTVGYPGTTGNSYPSQAMALPNLVNNGNMEVLDATVGWKIADLSGSYATALHPYSPAVTGKCGYMFMMIGTNDVGAGTAATTVESALTTLWATVKSDGWTLTVFTLTPTVDTEAVLASKLAVNQWIRAQSGLWDRLIDASAMFPDPYNQQLFYTDYGHFLTAGYAMIARAVNQSIGTKESTIPSFPLTPAETTGYGNVRLNYTAGGVVTSGYQNLFGGDEAGLLDTTGYQNTFLGAYAGSSTSTGNANVFLGASAGASNTTANNKTALGALALTNSTGQNSTAFGAYALLGETTGAANVGLGSSSCLAITTGYYNLCAGYSNGPTLVSGNNDILLGQGADVSAAGAIGRAQIGSGSNATDNTIQFQGWNYMDANGNGKFNTVAETKGAAIASASTIAPVSGITHITGTTAIATITVPVTGFVGCIHLIPDGAFTTTTAGNIALASVAVLNKQLEECFDGIKWYPSY